MRWKIFFRKYFGDFLVTWQPFSSKRLYFIITSHRWVSQIFFTVIKTMKRSGSRALCMISSVTMSWLINCEGTCSLLMLQVIDFRFRSTSSSFFCKSIQLKVSVRWGGRQLTIKTIKVLCFVLCSQRTMTRWLGSQLNLMTQFEFEDNTFWN